MSAKDWMTGLVAGVVVASALSVVWVKHESRKLFVTLQKLERARDDLYVEWGQLRLEQSTWATHGRIETVAREQLGMQLPQAEEIVLVTP